MGPPLVDEDWRAICEASYKGFEGAEWENLYHKFVEMYKDVNVRYPSGTSRATTLVESHVFLCAERHLPLGGASRCVTGLVCDARPGHDASVSTPMIFF